LPLQDLDLGYPLGQLDLQSVDSTLLVNAPLLKSIESLLCASAVSSCSVLPVLQQANPLVEIVDSPVQNHCIVVGCIECSAVVGHLLVNLSFQSIALGTG